MKWSLSWSVALLLVLVLAGGATAEHTWIVELAEANVNAMFSEMRQGDVEMVELYFSAYDYLVVMMISGAQAPDKEMQLTAMSLLGELITYLHSELSQNQGLWQGKPALAAVVDTELARIGTSALKAVDIALEDADAEVQTHAVLALATVLGMVAEFDEKTIAPGDFGVVVQPDPQALAAARERLQVLADTASEPGPIAGRLMELAPEPAVH